jgi:7,8-dihydropterin-6-yl-methyl-4-(beta-D-ribofuranosyl)aminobenzene 5'-phosphate synthase
MTKDSISITVLVENTVSREELRAEHGLSVLIETPHGQILWDTGQSPLFIENARKMGVQIENISSIALSHGHYDHTGGLSAILALNPRMKVYGHPDIFVQRFTRNRSSIHSVRPIGSPIIKKIVQSKCQSLELNRQPSQIIPGVFLTGEIPRITEYEDTGGYFFIDISCAKNDPIMDDQALYIESSQGIVVLLGCAHSGVVNTLNHVSKLTRQEKIFAVLGGMHLLGASNERLEATAVAFARYDVQVIGPCHCTGLKAITYLRSQFPDRFVECSTGSRFTFGEKI